VTPQDVATQACVVDMAERQRRTDQSRFGPPEHGYQGRGCAYCRFDRLFGVTFFFEGGMREKLRPPRTVFFLLPRSPLCASCLCRITFWLVGSSRGLFLWWRTSLKNVKTHWPHSAFCHFGGKGGLSNSVQNGPVSARAGVLSKHTVYI